MNFSFIFRILIATVPWGGFAAAAEMTKQPKVALRALVTMSDIVPRVPVAAPFLQIHKDDCHGWWGNLFGDDQAAALIAVEPMGNGKKDSSFVGAHLFLLLWQNGWQMAQEIGPVAAWKVQFFSPYQGWCLKVRAGTRECFLLSHSDINAAWDQQSWLLDSSAHNLKVTGWPRDARASISAATITLVRSLQGRPATRVVHHFDGQIGDEIITVCAEYDSHNIPTETLTQPKREKQPSTSWLVRPKSSDSLKKIDRYSICHRSPSMNAAPFEEHAVIDFSWGEDNEESSASLYLFHRLTGLNRAAYFGEWDQDETRKLLVPKSVKVTGDQEAQKLSSLEPK